MTTPETRQPEVFILIGRDSIGIPNGETVGFYVERVPRSVAYLLALRCARCGDPSLVDGTVEATESDERSMGIETYYSTTDSFSCPTCKQEMTLDILSTHYASGWFCEADCKNAAVIRVNGLDWFASLMVNLDVARQRIEKLRSSSLSLSQRLQLVSEALRKGRFSVLIVEGKDDSVIWTQLLTRSRIDMNRVDVVTYGEGGKSEAVKAGKMFRSKLLKNIPHKLILDSDSEITRTAKELTKVGLTKSDFHVLEEKEIESYLLNAEAIASVLHEDPERVSSLMKNVKGGGKEKLERVFKALKGPPLDASIKGLLARALPTIPAELQGLIDEVRDSLLIG